MGRSFAFLKGPWVIPLPWEEELPPKGPRIWKALGKEINKWDRKEGIGKEEPKGKVPLGI